MLQIVIPISDNQVFFPKGDFFFPKPIVEILDKPLIVQVINHLEQTLNPDLFIFVIPKELEIKWSIKKIISLSLTKQCNFFIRENETSGSLSSCLLASDLIKDGEVIISNMDEIIEYDLFEVIQKFRKNECSAGLLAFNSSHPRWAYALINQKNQVAFCAEKKVISKHAIAGFYYFQNKSIFIESCSKALLEDDSYNDQYFLSSAINQIILLDKKVEAFQIPANKHHSLFSPKMIEKFINCDFAKNLLPESNKKDLNIVIPAAGRGSRFSREGWLKPKPFIDVNGKTMIQHVVDNLSTSYSNVLLVLQEYHIENYSNILPSSENGNLRIVPIDYISSGTACTVLQARKFINNEAPLLIANSDQLVNFNSETFIEDAISRNLDGSILVFKDHELNPKWSFAKINNNGFVTEVAEKKPISNLATVGIYYFKKGSDFVDAALEMIQHDDRVNNEFYTCPVYNYLLKNNKKIGIFEIKSESMNGLGTPEDLISYQNKMNFDQSIDQPTI